MFTKKLFKKDVYIKECTAEVLELHTDNKEIILILDQTLFFPTGGGQPCDLGLIDEVNLSAVSEENGVVQHHISAQSNCFSVGQTVTLRLNWDRRFNHMQRHCGEHILSGIFFRELGAVNQGFHMGEEYMTIDLSVPDITWEQAVTVEEYANKVVWSDTPTTIRHFEKREDAELLPLRKPLALDEDITIVCVGNVDNPADCVACCGTHPKTAGQVGLIKILKLESYKGMTRVYFKAGLEAYEDYATKHELITALSKRYSASVGDLLEKIKVQEDKNTLVRKKLYDLKKVLLSKAAAEISEKYDTKQDMVKTKNESMSPSGMPIVRMDYSYFELEDLQTLGRQVTPLIKGLLLLVSQNDHTIMLFSNGNPDCGKLVRDNAEIYQGKGGGNNTGARAIFSKSEYVDTFIDLLEKHLR